MRDAIIAILKDRDLIFALVALGTLILGGDQLRRAKRRKARACKIPPPKTE